MQRWLLVASVAALAIAAAWLLRNGEPSSLPHAAVPAVAGAATPVHAAAAEAPALRDEAPPAAVPAPVELHRDEIDAMRRWLRAGELEALVVRGGQPLAGVRVRGWPRPPGRPGSANERGPATVEGRTDAHGRVLFASMAGGEFVVRADHDGRYVETVAKVQPEGQGDARTVVLPFGSASIAGSVRTSRRSPTGPTRACRLRQVRRVTNDVFGFANSYSTIALRDEFGPHCKLANDAPAAAEGKPVAVGPVAGRITGLHWGDDANVPADVREWFTRHKVCG